MKIQHNNPNAQVSDNLQQSMYKTRGTEGSIRNVQALSAIQAAIKKNKPEALADDIVEKLAVQFQEENANHISRLQQEISEINARSLPEEDKKALCTQAYNKSAAELYQSLTALLNTHSITPLYHHKLKILTQCHAQLNSATDEQQEVFKELLNRVHIRLIGFNGMLERYKMQVFGFDESAPKLDGMLL